MDLYLKDLVLGEVGEKEKFQIEVNIPNEEEIYPEPKHHGPAGKGRVEKSINRVAKVKEEGAWSGVNFYNPVKGEVAITKLTDRLLAEFDIPLKIRLTCNRCLKEFDFKMPLKFQQEYLLTPQFSEDKDTLNVKSDFSIDLEQPIIEEALVQLPTKVLCKKSCQGLCPECGLDLNKHPKHHH